MRRRTRAGSCCLAALLLICTLPVVAAASGRVLVAASIAPLADFVWLEEGLQPIFCTSCG
jgi:hypothetical protein